MKAPIALALDAPSLDVMSKWVADASPHVDVMKVGLETFLRDGFSATSVVREHGSRLFLDLKLHDIPNTVAGACRSIAAAAPDFLTVHAAGGPAMIAAAAETLPDTAITAVTILTSMSAQDVAAVGYRGTPLETVVLMAEMAVAAGARAIVCSPQEVSAVRAVVPADITLITPGVRPAGSAAGDQVRVATPTQAFADGADIVVIGRPITAAADISRAAAEIAAEVLNAR